MLDRISFRSARWIVAYRNSQTERVSQFHLQKVFPAARPTAIAAPAVSENKQFGSLWIERPTELSPPPDQSVDCQFGRISRLRERDVAQVLRNVVKTVRHRLTRGVGGEVVGVDRCGFTTPLPATGAEVSRQLLFLSIYADTGPACFSKSGSLTVQVLKLSITLRVGFGVEALDIAFGSNLLLAQQTSNRLPTQHDSGLFF